MDTRQLRRRAKLTQNLMAQLLGRDPSWLSRVERGLTPPGEKDLEIFTALRRTLRKKKVPDLRAILNREGRLSAIRRLAVS